MSVLNGSFRPFVWLLLFPIPMQFPNIPPFPRHVILPKEMAKTLAKNRLLTENEWRGMNVQQSRGWQHYAIHRPEPHILLFRRPLGTDPASGRIVRDASPFCTARCCCSPTSLTHPRLFLSTEPRTGGGRQRGIQKPVWFVAIEVGNT